MAASLVGVGLFLLAGQAPAQQPITSPSGLSGTAIAQSRPASPASGPVIPVLPPLPVPVDRSVPAARVVLPGASAPVLPALPVPTAQTTPSPRNAAPAAPRPQALVIPSVTKVSAPTQPPVQPTALQQPQMQPPMDQRAASDENLEYQVQLAPPGPQRVFRLESEAALHERMRQEARERPAPERIEFPVEPIISKESYSGRFWPVFKECVEPSYVCHRRLLFEEKNAERFGWDFGIFQPLLSAGYFYWDVATLPYHLGTKPLEQCDCSAGKCLPGDPVPYRLYPPDLSITGTLAEAGTFAALVAIFP